MKWLKVCGIVVLFVSLAGCMTHVKPSSSTVILKDGAPDHDVDVSNLADAIPRQELIRNAGNKTPYTVLGKTYHINFDTKGFSETGYASWYGKKFHGNKTSNGEVYDMYAMTAAHKTLAIPSYVRVTNLENQQVAIVRVNDRGPFHEGRIIDLSYAAAKKLGFHNKGVAQVKIEVLEPELPAAPTVAVAQTAGHSSSSHPLNSVSQAYLQLGAFSKMETANAFLQRVAAATGVSPQVRAEPARNLYKVLIGPIVDNFELLTLKQKLLEGQFPEPHLVEL